MRPVSGKIKCCAGGGKPAGAPDADRRRPGAAGGSHGAAVCRPFGRAFDQDAARDRIGTLGKSYTPLQYCQMSAAEKPESEPEEAQACLPFLRMQVALVRPKIIVLLGKVACRWTLGEEISITRGHGVWHERKGVWFLPTFHPSALLRDPAKKADAWEDFQKICAEKCGNWKENHSVRRAQKERGFWKNFARSWRRLSRAYMKGKETPGVRGRPDRGQGAAGGGGAR